MNEDYVWIDLGSMDDDDIRNFVYGQFESNPTMVWEEDGIMKTMTYEDLEKEIEYIKEIRDGFLTGEYKTFENFIQEEGFIEKEDIIDSIDD